MGMGCAIAVIAPSTGDMLMAISYDDDMAVPRGGVHDNYDVVICFWTLMLIGVMALAATM
eukprot:9008919-Pyramimonas_sp.AAC.1